MESSVLNGGGREGDGGETGGEREGGGQMGLETMNNKINNLMTYARNMMLVVTDIREDKVPKPH